MLDAAELSDDIATLKAMLIAAEVRDRRKDERIASWKSWLRRSSRRPRASIGKKRPGPVELALEDLETAIAVVQAEEDAEDRLARRPAKPRSANRGSLPKHLPRIEEIIEPQNLVCGCGGELHCIGEDVSERLDVIPAQFRVIVTRRPKYACRSCTDGVVQAPAPARLTPAGCRQRLWSPMFWSANTPIIFPCTVRLRSTAGRVLIWTARPSPTGLVVPPSSCGQSMMP